MCRSMAGKTEKMCAPAVSEDTRSTDSEKSRYQANEMKENENEEQRTTRDDDNSHINKI